MNYICTECGNIFEEGEEKLIHEPHGEKIKCCPCCNGTYEEAKPCKICGEFVCSEHEEYCNECKENVKARFSKFIENNFTKEERELLNELYDGEEI